MADGTVFIFLATYGTQADQKELDKEFKKAEKDAQ